MAPCFTPFADLGQEEAVPSRGFRNYGHTLTKSIIGPIIMVRGRKRCYLGVKR